METFEVTQAVMTVGSTYQVSSPGATAVLMTVKGSLMSPTPKFQLVSGDDGPELATLTGNFIKTKFQVKGADSQELGNLSFPAIAFKKTLVLTVGGRGFTADGGLMGGAFRCIDNDGKVGLEISYGKAEAFRDRFTVTIHDNVSKEVAILSSVAIHSRFFEFV
jgi:uncharacterized protein YxjI